MEDYKRGSHTVWDCKYLAFGQAWKRRNWKRVRETS